MIKLSLNPACAQASVSADAHVGDICHALQMNIEWALLHGVHSMQAHASINDDGCELLTTGHDWRPQFAGSAAPLRTLIDNGYFPRKRDSTVGPASLAMDTYMHMFFNIRDSVTVGEFAFGLAEGSIALIVRDATILSWD